MNCIVIDDEPLAREAMKKLIVQLPELQFKAEFSHSDTALTYIKTNKIDLIFLDIQMPGVDGISFARMITDTIQIIFTTAFYSYAVESYELNAVDYLLKPIKTERFKKAVEKAIVYQNLLKRASASVDQINLEYFFIRSEKKVMKVSFADVLYIEGLKDYVILHTKSQKIIAAMNIKTIQGQLPQDIFIRVSKSYVINKRNIDYFDNNTVYMDLHEIPIGNSYRDFFFDIVKKDLVSK
ncbi:LytR/AlgR family response regulator transcription factor [Pedobacter suwonensis]|uniref:LytR/AlgR family response regulator transcription factor n=1 Tax=Pedobacter suwonensis TaxID=332999 RepID=UPI0011A020F6|nr:LytTR family DNA-binding domain-containing protein [Pedobacter suwonensis]